VQKADARELLSLPLTFTADELQQAWREAARAAHPDAGGSDEAMAALNAARAALESAVVMAVSGPAHVLQISSDGTVVGPGGERLGRCGSVAGAVQFCERAGWEYALSKELPVSA
jgi:hypothetical protein